MSNCIKCTYKAIHQAVFPLEERGNIFRVFLDSEGDEECRSLLE